MCKRTIISIIFLIVVTSCVENPINEIIQDSSITWERLKFSTGSEPSNGYVSIVGISRDDKVIIYDHGNNFISNDDGNTWTKMEGIPVDSKIIMDKKKNLFVSDEYSDIYKSNDNGNIWTKIHSPGWYSKITCNLSDEIFIRRIHDMAPGANNELIKSSNNGDSWEIIFDNCTSFQVDNNDFLYCWDSDSLLVSTNSGNKWTSIVNSLGYIRDFQKDDDGVFYLNTEFGLFKSVNDGDSWDEIILDYQINNNLYLTSDNSLFFTTYNFQTELTSLYLLDKSTEIPKLVYVLDKRVNNVESYGSSIFIGTEGYGLFVSQNNGNTWNNINFTPPAINALAFTQEGRLIIGDFYSDNYGESWHISKFSYGSHYIESIAIDSRGNIFMPEAFGVYKSTNSGISYDFIRINGVGAQSSSIVSNEEDVLFAVYHHDGVYRSQNDGLSWVKVLDKSSWLRTLIANQNKLLLGTDEGLFISEDSGETWKMSSMNKSVFSIVVNSANDIYVGTYQNGVYLSKDFGTTWESLNLNFRYLAIEEEDNIIFGWNPGLSFSNDGGNSWNEVEIARDVSVKSVLIENEINMIFVGTYENGLIRGQIN